MGEMNRKLLPEPALLKKSGRALLYSIGHFFSFIGAFNNTDWSHDYIICHYYTALNKSEAKYCINYYDLIIIMIENDYLLCNCF